MGTAERFHFSANGPKLGFFVMNGDISDVSGLDGDAKFSSGEWFR